MKKEQVVISFWPKRHEHFSDTKIPSTLEELTRWCANLDNQIFDAENKSNKEILEEAFDFYNYTQSEFSAPDKLNEIARTLKCHVSATAGDVFCIQNDTTVDWWYCASFGWEPITIR